MAMRVMIVNLIYYFDGEKAADFGVLQGHNILIYINAGGYDMLETDLTVCGQLQDYYVIQCTLHRYHF